MSETRAICAHCGAETASTSTACGACGADWRLDGRDRLEARLGHGASGTTYRATRLQDGQPVAIKELLVRQLEDLKAQELFSREAAALEALRHAGIPRYHDDFTAGDGHQLGLYLVTELIDGHTLEEELRTTRHSQRDAIAIAAELCEVLTYLHGLAPPVVHRDIKPSNIMRRRGDRSLVLIDFGAVKESLRGGELGGSTVAGTFGYMPPEQLVGRATPASDLYALGVLLVVLTTRLPLNELLDDLNHLRWEPHVPTGTPLLDGLRDVLRALLERDPSRRLADAAELRRRLLAILDGTYRPHRAEPAPIVESVQSDGAAVAILPDLTRTCYDKRSQVDLKWWQERTLVWPVAARANYAKAPRGNKPGLHTPEDLARKVCGPPSYGFRFDHYNPIPRGAWRAGVVRREVTETLELDFGPPTPARALYLFISSGTLGEAGMLRAVSVLDAEDREVFLYTHGDPRGPLEGTTPALFVFDFGGELTVRKARVTATAPLLRRLAAPLTIDTAGLRATVPPRDVPEKVDHRPTRRPERTVLQSYGLLTGAILAIVMAMAGVMTLVDGPRQEDEALATPPPSAEPAAPAHEPPTSVEFAETGARAEVMPRRTAPPVDDQRLIWADRALLSNWTGSAFEVSGPVDAIGGPPGPRAFDAGEPLGELRSLTVFFADNETPVRELLVFGSSPGSAVIGITGSDDGKAEGIWYAMGETDRLSADGDVLRVTLPRARVFRRVLFVLRPRGPAAISGVALVRE